MRLPLYQIDAFTARRFGGNPAAVVVLEDWLPDGTLQAIAAENNLAETAFLRREGGDYALRWFTPTVEVDLCGHATLASAYAVFRFLEPERESVGFRTEKAGRLTVTRLGDVLAMDFPARPPRPCDAPPGLAEALGKAPFAVLAARDLLAVYAREEDVAGLAPDIAALARLDCFAVMVSAPGSGGVDFVSRFFAPRQGIPEDPVTGSAHCTLIPYWAARLGKETFTARQLSPRGGDLRCALRGERVEIAGHCALYLEGTITV